MVAVIAPTESLTAEAAGNAYHTVTNVTEITTVVTGEMNMVAIIAPDSLTAAANAYHPVTNVTAITTVVTGKMNQMVAGFPLI